MGTEKRKKETQQVDPWRFVEVGKSYRRLVEKVRCRFMRVVHRRKTVRSTGSQFKGLAL